MDLLTLFLAFVIAFGTMFIGAISGGVGLLLRPLLILIGFPAPIVIGTVRIADIPGEFPAIFLLHKKKIIDWKLVKIMIPPMFIGSLISGIFILSIPPKTLQLLIGVLLLFVEVVLLIQNRLRDKKHATSHPTKMRHAVGLICTAIVGFFNVIVGGLVPLLSSLYILNYKKKYIDASVVGKVTLYIGANLASFVFILGNIVNWELSVVLFVGFALGSIFGVRFGLKQGEGWIRALVLIVVFASAIKFIFFP